MDIDTLLDKLKVFGLEYLRLYTGLYAANVIDVADPEKRGRIRVISPAIGQTQPVQDQWLLPLFAAAGSERGTFWPPEVGDSVHIFMLLGKTPRGYLGGWYGNPNQKSELPIELGYSSAGMPTKRGFVTRMGHSFVVEDTPGSETVRLTWRKPPDGDKALSDKSVTAARSGDKATLEFSRSGVSLVSSKGDKLVLDTVGSAVTLKHNGGSTVKLSKGSVELDAGGGTITLKAGTVNVQATNVLLGKGVREPIPLGRKLLQWLLGHTHGTPFGPTSTPLTPPTDTLLSPTNSTK